MFADDTSLTAYGKSIEEIELGLNEDLQKIRLWLQAKKLSLNVAKTEYMLIVSRQRLAKLPYEPNIYVLGSKESEIPKFLECILMNLLRGASILKK